MGRPKRMMGCRQTLHVLWTKWEKISLVVILKALGSSHCSWGKGTEKSPPTPQKGTEVPAAEGTAGARRAHIGHPGTRCQLRLSLHENHRHPHLRTWPTSWTIPLVTAGHRQEQGETLSEGKGKLWGREQSSGGRHWGGRQVARCWFQEQLEGTSWLWW